MGDDKLEICMHITFSMPAVNIGHFLLNDKISVLFLEINLTQIDRLSFSFSLLVCPCLIIIILRKIRDEYVLQAGMGSDRI